MTSSVAISRWIERRAQRSPDRWAIVHGATTITYADLADRVRRLASRLWFDAAVRPGDRVGWIGDNHPAFLEMLFATARIGAVFAPVNHRLGEVAIRELLDRYGARLVAVHGASVDLPLPGRARFVVGATDGARLDVGHDGHEGGSDDRVPEIDVALDDVCLMPHTSGTTGRPKGVMLTHGNVTWNVVNVGTVAELRSDDVTIAIAPFFRTGGTGVNVLPVLFHGGTVVIPERSTPDEILALMSQHRVTIGFGNPDLLDSLVRSESWETTDLSSIRFCMTGGAPVPERLVRTYQARGISFLQGYGLSEAAPLVLLLDAVTAQHKVGAAGKPPLFVDVRVESSDGREAKPNEIGELVTRGPNVMTGYWDDPRATAEAIVGGWLHTGDAARVDEDGDTWIVGRMSDAFELSGHVVHPGEIERVLMQHPAVLDAAVIQDTGRLVAVVVIAEGDVTDTAELLARCQDRLPAHAVPTDVRTVPSLPRSSVGKLLRHEVEASHQ